MSSYRTGAVALIGKPNVGKSTLVNLLVGQKVSIVSDKPQTTRHRILGIFTTPEYQIILADTPGVHEPHTELGKRMVASAKGALVDVDMVLFVADVSRAPTKDDEEIAELLKRNWNNPHGDGPGIILCLNKMDMLKPEHVVENVERFCKLLGSEEYMLTCLTKVRNVDKLVELIVQHLPEGEPLFPDDEFTDQPMRRLAAELIREKALQRTRQEIPHALATIVELWEETDEIVRITASIFVEKDGQKAIIIGKGGSMLKEIGTETRAELEQMLDKKVYLELVVKVREDWRQNPRMLHDLELT